MDAPAPLGGDRLGGVAAPPSPARAGGVPGGGGMAASWRPCPLRLPEPSVSSVSGWVASGQIGARASPPRPPQAARTDALRLFDHENVFAPPAVAAGAPGRRSSGSVAASLLSAPLCGRRARLPPLRAPLVGPRREDAPQLDSLPHTRPVRPVSAARATRPGEQRTCLSSTRASRSALSSFWKNSSDMASTRRSMSARSCVSPSTAA